jgi:hypothetical protein
MLSRRGFMLRSGSVGAAQRRSRKLLTSDGYRYRLARRQKSIKGVNGPDV